MALDTFNNSKFTCAVDNRSRINLPKPLMELAKIKTHVEFELTGTGILIKPFSPQTIEYCSICKSLDKYSLVEIRRGTFVCHACISMIAKAVPICREE